MKKNIVANWMAAKHVLSFPKIRHVHHWQFRDYLFSFWSTHVVILVCVKSEVVFSMHLLYLLSNTQYFISSWWLGKIFELLRDYFGAALLILSIRHANIGIVFLYIENSQWRLYMNSQSDLTQSNLTGCSSLHLVKSTAIWLDDIGKNSQGKFDY